ncbi:MAG: DUF3769 domain-containing protein [Microcoleaceae cyanobacterium]
MPYPVPPPAPPPVVQTIVQNSYVTAGDIPTVTVPTTVPTETFQGSLLENFLQPQADTSQEDIVSEPIFETVMPGTTEFSAVTEFVPSAQTIPQTVTRLNQTVSYRLPLPRTEALQEITSADSLGPSLSVRSSDLEPVNLSPNATQSFPPQSFPVQVAQADSNQTAEPTIAPQPSADIPVILPSDSIEVTADRQEFDQQRQIITATGNVMIRFRQTLIDADRAQVNLATRQVVADGQVALTRGEQVVRGNRMEYNLVRNTGVIFEANGSVLTSSAARDLSAENNPVNINNEDFPAAPISDRITSAQPVENISATEGADVNVSGLSLPNVGGNVRRLRFEADRIDIASDGSWEATNIRITNDPFSPPEIELQADTAKLNRLSPLQDELLTTGSRLVFDQSFSLPLFRDRTIIDRRQRDASPFSIGYDLDDLGGYFVQWNAAPLLFGPLELDLSPQFLAQRAIESGGPFDPDSFGLRANLSGPLGTRTFLDSRLRVNSFDGFPSLDEDDYRASVRLRQFIGDYTLTAEYSYRDRLFNGTLGFQTVQSTYGAILTSPLYDLGTSGAQFRFQTAFQRIDARTDQLDLLAVNRDNDRISRTRFQTLANFTYPITLWQGEPLPATATEGLRYTPRPVIPFVKLVFLAQGVVSLYSEGESQSYLVAGAGLQGQLGNFSDDFFDYTGFNLFYTQVIQDGESPFLFDRRVDDRVLTIGLVQQIYGGLRAGFESSINLDNGLALNNEFTLEYSRRTYGVLLRINPVRRVGSLNLRISDFNWTGNPGRFSGRSE